MRDRLLGALDRIGRRLGGLHKAEVAAALEQGFESGDHLAWIERLLTWYYDPMYDYQLAKKQDRVIFRGAAAETEAFLAGLHQAPAVSSGAKVRSQ